jgi:hypothetical protein
MCPVSGASFNTNSASLAAIYSEILRYQKFCLDLHKRVAGLALSNVAWHRYCGPPKLAPE